MALVSEPCLQRYITQRHTALLQKLPAAFQAATSEKMAQGLPITLMERALHMYRMALGDFSDFLDCPAMEGARHDLQTDVLQPVAAGLFTALPRQLSEQVDYAGFDSQTIRSAYTGGLSAIQYLADAAQADLDAAGKQFLGTGEEFAVILLLEPMRPGHYR